MKVRAAILTGALLLLPGCAVVQVTGQMVSWVGSNMQKAAGHPDSKPKMDDKISSGRKSDRIEGY